LEENHGNTHADKSQPLRRIDPRKLKGFRDYLPGPMRLRQMILTEIRSVAQASAFHEIATPALEYQETLLGQGGDETDKQVYRFEDHGGRKVALRFDLTVPFARFVAEHQGTLVFPFKKLQIGDVWRGENTQKGRYREFTQCDFDIIGVDSVAADVEVMLALATVLARIPAGGVTMHINHRGLLSGLLSAAFGAGIAPEDEAKALIAIDKLAKVGQDEVRKMLAVIPAKGGRRSEDAADLVVRAISGRGATGESDLEILRDLVVTENPSAWGALEPHLIRVREVLEILERTGPRSGVKFKVDLSVARGLGYYTGMVFETTMDRLPGFGSVSSGGRYNDLASRFTNRELPGVGGSIGLDRLVAGIEELGTYTQQGTTGWMVAVASREALPYAFEILNLLRTSGVSADIGLTEGKVGNQFKHASRLGYSHVVTVGEEEMKSRSANLKNMATGEEAKGLPIAGILAQTAK
jgi:histidyl-tRNA synthetase